MFVSPSKLIISYVYIKYISELNYKCSTEWFFENEISCKYKLFLDLKVLTLFKLAVIDVVYVKCIWFVNKLHFWSSFGHVDRWTYDLYDTLHVFQVCTGTFFIESVMCIKLALLLLCTMSGIRVYI